MVTEDIKIIITRSTRRPKTSVKAADPAKFLQWALYIPQTVEKTPSEISVSAARSGSPPKRNQLELVIHSTT